MNIGIKENFTSWETRMREKEYCSIADAPKIDLIDGQAALDLEEWFGDRATYDNPMPTGVHAVPVDAIKSLPSVEQEIKEKLDEAYMSGYTDAESKFREMMKPQWIPCSEKMPEGNNVDVLATVKIGGEVRETCLNYSYKQWFDCIFEAWLDPKIVIAWCELPEPYRGDSE